MTTESEIKLARYNKIEREADDFGRVIGVRRLRPSEQTKAAGYTADLTGSDEVLDEDGNKVLVPHRLPLMIAATVCEIDGDPVSFARNRGELDAIYDRLDAEGTSAAGRAATRLQQGSEDAVDDALEAAKN
jgi:hypothetical protein